MYHKLLNRYHSLSVQMKATACFFVCSVLQKGISVITTPIFTRLLSTEEYGQFSVFNSWLSIISIIVTLQLTAGVYTMGIVKFKEDEKQFTSSLQGLNLVLCLAWTGIYLVFHDFWNGLFSLTTVQVLAMLLMIWASSTFAFWMTTQRNAYRYKALVLVTLLVSLAKPLVGILFVVLAEDKVTARILGLVLVEVIAYSGFFVAQMYRGKKFFSAKYWKYAVIFNFPLIPHYLAGSILSGSDRIMIEKMAGESEAGIYGLAYSVSLIMMMVNDSLNKTMSPWLYQKIRARELGSIHKVVYASLAIIAGANLVLIAVAPEIVAIFAPPEYYEAIYVIPPVAMSGFMTYLYLCFAPFEFTFEKRSWTTIGTFTSAIVNLGLNYLLIPVFGYCAAGYTTLICYALNSALHYFLMRKICKRYLDDARPYDCKILLLLSILFVGLGLLYILTYQNIVVRYGLIVILILGVFMNRKKMVPWIQSALKK